MKSYSFWFLFLLLTFVVTLPVTWWGLAQTNFFYGPLHDATGIDKHIQTFAPRNRFNKKDFEKTSKQTRVSLFNDVVIAIHNNGKGLESLAYLNSQNQRIHLFTDAEVTHLKDVAVLLNKLKPIILGIVVLWILVLIWLYFKRIKLPSAKRLITMSFIWVVIAILLLMLGPEKIFNQLHVWAFPKDNQWFFYYEESLMSTMMMAPYLFAYITAIWAFLSILVTIILFKCMHPILSRTR